MNGLKYVIRKAVKRKSQQPFADAFRTIGVQQRVDVQTRSSFVLPTPIYGFGLSRIRDMNDPKQVQRFWDSTCETRFPGQITLPALNQDATEPSNPATYTLKAMKRGLEHAGVLFGFWSALKNDGTQAIYSFTNNGSSWNNNPVLVYNAGVDSLSANVIVSLADAVVHKGLRWVLTSSTQDGGGGSTPSQWGIYSAPAGAAASYTSKMNASWPAGGASSATYPTSEDQNNDGGLLLDYGNTLIAVLWGTAANTIGVYYSTNSGAAWTAGATIISANGPTGVAIYYDQAGNVAPVIGTREGVYALNSTFATATLILPMTSTQDVNNGRRMAVWNSTLYVPTGDGGMLSYFWDGSVAHITPMGPNLYDGLPVDTQGHVVNLLPSSQWLFASYSGSGAATKARLLAWDGIGWHSYFKNGTVNQEIDWMLVSTVGGTQEMHVAVRTGANATDMRYVEKPLVNPYSDATFKYDTAGYIIRPDFNAGFPDINAAWLKVNLEMVSPTASETITESYFTNGGAVSTSLGALNSTTPSANFGSGVGVSAISVQLTETYARGPTNTNSPQGRTTQLSYLKRPDELEEWAFIVDLKATAEPEPNSQRNVETIIAELRALRPPTQIILVVFNYGQNGPRNVVVDPFSANEMLDELYGPIANEEREGLVTVTCREVI